MIKHIKINSENLKAAIKVERELFPDHDAIMEYKESIESASEMLHYFLLYVGDNVVGVSGLYRLPMDRESAWLGWFGIKPEYRRRRYGSDALHLCEETARDLGYRTMRVLLERDSMENSVRFFTMNGYSMEQYFSPADPISRQKDFLILSKALYPERLALWNNRDIHLTDTMNKRKK